MANPTLKDEIKSKLNPFLDSLTPEELSVFKWMVKKLRSSLISDTDDDSIETNVVEK
jgi:hypothetical protein